MSNPLASMTGFARAEGKSADLAWVWELRSVNGRGLDVRFRLPAGWDTLEPSLRELAGRMLRRGNVTATLSVRRESELRLVVDSAALEQALTLAMDLHKRLPGSAVPRAEALLALPGVLRPALPDDTTVDMSVAVAGFSRALAELVAARHAEGARLAQTLLAQLDEIAAFHGQAVARAADQPAIARARIMDNLNELLREAPSMPEDRIAQEVALLATRSDVREELDRLASHIEAARGLLREGTNIGRRFDFLLQEFNRETNTLCSKSSSIALTTTGLKLKATLEQLREQVQNIE
jgi:uncharacterized protein (TIGR00255 family)